MKELCTSELSNGIRVVYQQVDNTRIVHCGIFLDVGSRDETHDTQGITHFWEHMAFKGTRKRKSYQILTSIDAVGGELNAYTDREKVVFFVTVRDQYFERAVDVLADIAFHSTFPDKEIEKERGVVLQEMAMYADNPDDSLQDEFEAVVFKGHPMGMNILGRPETVGSFKRKDFVNFFKDRLDTTRIVFSCVGNLPFDVVEKVVKKHLRIRKAKRSEKRAQSTVYKPKRKELYRPVKQARCAIGRAAYPVNHKNRFLFYILVNILGGPGMNSRLNMALREKHGYVYSVEAIYIPYTDTGLFAVFFGTKPGKLDRCIELVRNELDLFCEKELTSRQLNAAREQIKGQMAIAEENNQNLMMMMGRMILDLGRVPSLEEVFGIIDSTKAVDLMELAQQMFDEQGLSYLKMIPK